LASGGRNAQESARNEEKENAMKIIKPKDESTVPRLSYHGNNWGRAFLVTKGDFMRKSAKPGFFHKSLGPNRKGFK
jgi:hypothetical protein